MHTFLPLDFTLKVEYGDLQCKVIGIGSEALLVSAHRAICSWHPGKADGSVRDLPVMLYV